MPAPGTPYTAAELHRAIALRAMGHTWAQVASILGRTRGSLKVTVCMWQKGTYRTATERAEARRQADEALVQAVTDEGISSAKVLSHRAGLSLTTTHRRLARLGLDSQTRRIFACAAQRRMPNRADRRLEAAGAAA